MGETRHHAAHVPEPPVPLRRWSPSLRLAAVAAVCLLGEAVVVRRVIDAEADWVALLAPLWVLLGLQAADLQDPRVEAAGVAMCVLVSVLVVILYAV